MKTEQKLGIYVHLPFCKKKCDYCDFYSISGTEMTEKMDQYQQALLAHFPLLAPSAKGFSVDTIYFGGGTPTLYGAGRIEALLRQIKKHYRVERGAEITVEGNPESLDKKTVTTLRRAGVNRISLGIQSTKWAELQAVGRIHSPEDSRQAVALCQAGQMKNISLDLIYGLPGQSQESWTETLEEAIALEPQHISCYGLKVEEGTPLYQRVAQGEQLPCEETQADLYLWTVARLAEAGFQQYEISNFAQVGKESRHNLGYWLGKSYLGFGASAASDFGGYRYTMVADLSHYCHCLLGEGTQIFASNELLSEKERQAEYVMLRLRTCHGLEGREYEKTCHLDFTPLEQRLNEFSAHHWAKCDLNGRWQLTPEGFLRSNLLIGDLLALQEQSQPPKPVPVFTKKGKKTMPEPEPQEKDGMIFQEDDWGQFYF